MDLSLLSQPAVSCCAGDNKECFSALVVKYLLTFFAPPPFPPKHTSDGYYFFVKSSE